MRVSETKPEGAHLSSPGKNNIQTRLQMGIFYGAFIFVHKAGILPTCIPPVDKNVHLESCVQCSDELYTDTFPDQIVVRCWRGELRSRILFCHCFVN